MGVQVGVQSKRNEWELYLSFLQLGDVGLQIKLYPIGGSVQCGVPDQQDQHEDVWRGGRNVHHLRNGLRVCVIFLLEGSPP